MAALKTLVLIALIALAFTFCVSAKKNAEVVQDFIDSVIVGGDFAKFDALIASDFVNHNLLATGSAANGGNKTTFKAEIERLRLGFPDIQFDVDDIFEGEDGKVTVRARLSGTHLGPFAGYAATNRSVSNIAVVSIVRVEQRLWRDRWNNSDYYTFFKQLGVI